MPINGAEALLSGISRTPFSFLNQSSSVAVIILTITIKICHIVWMKMSTSKAKVLKYVIEALVGLIIFVGLGRIFFIALYLILGDKLNAPKIVEIILVLFPFFSAAIITYFIIRFIHKHLEIGPF
jgi:hypothetical protein